MTRAAALSVAVFGAFSLACTFGDPLELDKGFWWIEVDGVEGDCPVMPPMAQGLWLSWDAQQDDPDLLELNSDLGLDGNEFILFCRRGEDCDWVSWDDGTQIVHHRLTGYDHGADAWEGTLESIGSCGPYCGAPGAETAVVTCEGSADVRVELLMAGTVRAAHPDDSCAVLDEPLGSRAEPWPVWVFNASSTPITVNWIGEAGEEGIAGDSGGGAVRIDGWVGDRLVVRDHEGECLRAFDVSTDLRYVLVD